MEKLEKIEQANASNGAVYNKLTISGKVYNYFGDITGLSVGDNVLCEFKTEGKYTNLKNIEKVESQSIAAQNVRHDLVVSRTEKPHSYEFGPANARHKIHYENVEELLAKIESLKNAGLISVI